jgi:Holliday junction DNA helicase RuvA
MIGRLHGVLVHKRPPHLFIDVAGVGYECEAPLSSFYVFPEEGAAVTVYTHFTVRDDGHFLYAFASLAERHAFRLLIKISGIGPKVACAVLSGLSLDELTRVIEAKDVALLTRLPGIGKKTAERIVMELADRAVAPSALNSSPLSSPRTEAHSALLALGYKEPEIQRLLKSIDADLPAEAQIRQALKGTLRA